MTTPDSDYVTDQLTPLVRGWGEKVNLAIEHKRTRFGDVAQQCMAFYAGLTGFMYEKDFQKKFVGGNFSPKFKITLNKAFEIVALYLPVIYNRNPIREVRPPDPFRFGPELFGQGEEAEMVYQQAAAEQQQRQAMLRAGCDVLERYLRYTPEEQPNGGLLQASENAVIEALVKGRGVLWQEPFTMPGSTTTLTGSFYDTVDRLLIDPDSESPNFGEAHWIAKICIEPHWKAERARGLPYGSLRNKGNLESAEAQGARRGNPRGAAERGKGTTFDLVRYYKIWSIGGIGARLTGTKLQMQEAFEEVVGDYAYIEVAPGVPYPLNLHPSQLAEATDEEVREAFSWPIPYWKDQRWPCSLLDFYRQPNCSWPISPLRPGLGELVALNIIMSHLTHHVYQNSRTLVAVLKSAQKDVEAALKSGEDMSVFGIPEILKDIDHLIKFVQGPPVNYDVWRIVEHLFNLFDKRVGLSDLLYGMNPGAASRTAPDAETKREALSVRPDYLASKVEAWQTDTARNEKLCAYFSGVSGESLRPLLGDVGAWVFDQAFANAEEEVVLREMSCSIRQGSARKPNRQRDAENLKEVYQPFSIQLGQYAQVTGDTGPLNELNRKLGEAMEIDMTGLEMGPLVPPEQEESPPDPAQEARAEKIRQDIEAEQVRNQQKLVLSEAEQAQKLTHTQQQHAADLLGKLAMLDIEAQRQQTRNRNKK